MAGGPDPVRLEVMKNALEGIADGMAVTLVRTSRSTVVRVSLDFSTAVLDSHGQLVGQGLCTPIHLGGMMPALAACLTYYKDDVRPGDILINNDPYEGGSHLPDIFLFKPIFIETTLIGYLCCMSHQIDIGGRVAGGNACDNSEIYQEGLRIPPLKLYEEGRRNATLFRILEKAVRVPDKVVGDITGQVAALNFGETELRALVGRIGVAEFRRETTELVDYTENLTRKAISHLPDGRWRFSDRIDDDGFGQGPLEIVATVGKQADRIEVDFTGTAPRQRDPSTRPSHPPRGLSARCSRRS
jgi:N-methylhydantoinase B